MGAAPVIIIGGGIVGLSAAYALSERGVESIVLDREAFGQSTSFGNAGLIVFGHPPINRPGVTRQGMRMLLDSTSPLYIKPRLSMDLLRWLISFRRHCTKHHFEKSLAVLAELGWASRNVFQAMRDWGDIACDWRGSGWLDVCLSERDLDRAATEIDLIAPHGYTARRLEGHALHQAYSGFTKNVVGAIHYTDSATLDPNAFMTGLRRALERDGVEIRSNADVVEVLQEAGTVRGVHLRSGERVMADTVVLAAGVWSSQLAEKLGVRIPMQPARGYHRDYSRLDGIPSIGGVVHGTSVAFTPMHDRLRLAGTLELAGFNHPWMPARLDALQAGAAKALCAIEHATESSDWAGYRPCTPDGLPIIGRAPRIDGLFISTGHAMMGMTLGPVSGRMIAEEICDERPSIDSPLLAVDRFG